MYNAELFIIQTLDSVLNQKKINMEIIVIDDGSTDNSYNIVKSYTNNITILQTSNKGASAARNLGLRHAKGKYIMFIDADDYLIDNEICYKCIDILNKTQYDMVLFSYQYLDNDSSVITKGYDYSNIKQSSNKIHLIEQLITSGIFPTSPCYRIINRAFLINNNIFFKEETIGEDILWFIKILKHITNFTLFNNACYIYRKNISTSVTGNSNIKKCFNHLQIIIDSCNEILSLTTNSRLKETLLSAISYQLCILIANAHPFINQNAELKRQIKELTWLLNYHKFPKIKYISYIYKLLGYNILSSILHFYLRHHAKSIY